MGLLLAQSAVGNLTGINDMSSELDGSGWLL